VSDRRRVHSGSSYEERYGYCRAIRVGDRVHISGTAPILPDGSCPPDARTQALRCFERILGELTELGGSPEHVVRTRMFITDAADADDVGAAHRLAFGEHPPAATMVVVAALIDPAWKVEIEADAVITGPVGPGRRGRAMGETIA
jgi:enamine deaminase RidA (YjgF/YER057c/UK114 family)